MSEDPVRAEDVALSARVPVELVERLDRCATRDQRSRSSALRQAIVEYCDRIDGSRR